MRYTVRLERARDNAIRPKNEFIEVPYNRPMTISSLLIEEDVNLQSLNTFGLPARARYFHALHEPQNLPALCAFAEQHGLPLLILGGGSNLVLTKDYPGLVIHVNLHGRQVLADSAPHHLVEVAAGENWHDTVDWLTHHGYPGLENLALIPGTVGAAPIQNIGAYGLEVAERLHSVRFFDCTTQTEATLLAADCDFGYRDSIFKQSLRGRAIILSVTFALPLVWQGISNYRDIADNLTGPITPNNIFNTVVRIRQQKLPDPKVLGNAGSFFKNPIVTGAAAASLLAAHPHCPHYPQADGTTKLAAGWLIEQAGWKGKQRGAVGVHERQALVLVNLGKGTGADILALAAQIQEDVFKKFGVRLEAEPIVV